MRKGNAQMLENLIEIVEEYGRFDNFADIITTGYELREILEELAEFFGGGTGGKIGLTIYCHDIGVQGFIPWEEFSRDDINAYSDTIWELLVSGGLVNVG